MSKNGVTGRTASQGSFFKVVKPFNGPKGTWNIGTYVYVQECVGDHTGTEYHVVLIRVDPDGVLPSQWIHDTSSADKFDTAVLNGTFVSNVDYEKIKHTLDSRCDSLQWCKKYLFHPHPEMNQVKTLANEIYMQTEQSTDKGDRTMRITKGLLTADCIEQSKMFKIEQVMSKHHGSIPVPYSRLFPWKAVENGNVKAYFVFYGRNQLEHDPMKLAAESFEVDQKEYERVTEIFHRFEKVPSDFELEE